MTDRDIAREIECLATRRLDVPKVHRDALLLRLDALGPPPATGVEALAMAYAREGEKDRLEALLKAIDAITPRPAVE